ncbi:4Fe-4S binding protein [Symbiobacterium thermophilum]|uniref:4Fe-4S binding protein n=1 Tax=Symbiobacterium thermophilum TaxID=2734 RepID=UPI0035C6E406
MKSRLGKVQTVIRRYRRASQLTVLALLIVSPFVNLFRFDLPSMSLYLFGTRLWVKHTFVFFMLLVTVIYVIIAASLLFGRVFCGWVCPQNLFNELTRSWDRRFGRAGSTLLSVVISLFGAFVVRSYFSDGRTLLAQYLSGQVPPGPTVFILGFTLFFTMAMAWWRTSVCRVACPYGHLQSIISNADTMHLQVFNLPGNRDICATCGLCAEICHMGVDPRTPEQKHCVVCGDCLDACALVSGARKVPRVLNFTIGSGDSAVALRDRGRLWQNVRQLAPRLVLPLILTVILGSLSAYMLVHRPRVDLVVAKNHRQVLAAGSPISSGNVMAVSIINLGNEGDRFHLYVEGLPDNWAALERSEIELEPGERASVTLRVHPTERIVGTHRFTVRVVGERSGAEASFDTVHVVY